MNVPMTLAEAMKRADDMLHWLGDTGQCKINEDDGEALRMLLPNSGTTADGLAILNAAEKPEVLVALLETYQLSPDLGLTVDYDAEREVTGKPWAAATYTMGNWCKVQDAEYGETRDAAILALAAKLKEDRGDAAEHDG